MASTPQRLQFAYSSSSLNSNANKDEEDEEEEEAVIALSCSPPLIGSQQEHNPWVGEGDHGIDRIQQGEHGNEKDFWMSLK